MIPPPAFQTVGLYPLPQAEGHHHLLTGKSEKVGGGERQVVG